MSNPIILYKNDKMRLEMVLNQANIEVIPFGVIDHCIDFSCLIWAINHSTLNSNKVIFNLISLTGMSLAGGNLWHKMTHQIKKSVKIVYKNINEFFLDQANAINEMCGHEYYVESLEAPFHCKNCQIDSYYLMLTEQIRIHNFKWLVSPMKCTKCNEVLKFSWIIEDYFKILESSHSKSEGVNYANG